MARIDPELALQWSADHGHRYDGRVRQAAAEMLAELDGPEALAMLTPADPSESQYTLQRLADRFAPTDPKKALLFAEEAVVRARALQQPDRAAALARAGTVLVQLGRAEAGRKLIEEAAEAATRMGTTVMDGYTRGVVAKALAPFDANRALRAVESTDYKDRYIGFVAAALAEKDPARAVALADAMAGNGPYPDRAKTEIASRIGADRPDEAIRIIEGMKSFAADYMRARGVRLAGHRGRPARPDPRLRPDRPRPGLAGRSTANLRELDQFRRRDGLRRPRWPPPRGRSATRT